MKPSVGRIVTAVGALARSNGATEAPALITRVWGQREDGAWTVNVTVFPDCGQPALAPSSLLWETPEQAREKAAEFEYMTPLHWPERVSE